MVHNVFICSCVEVENLKIGRLKYNFGSVLYKKTCKLHTSHMDYCYYIWTNMMMWHMNISVFISPLSAGQHESQQTQKYPWAHAHCMVYSDAPQNSSLHLTATRWTRRYAPDRHVLQTDAYTHMTIITYTVHNNNMLLEMGNTLN